MKQACRVFLTCLCLLAIPCRAATDEKALEVVSAAFGTFELNKSNQLDFVPGTVVPHRLDQRYGWVIELKTRKRRVSVREEYLLPPKEQSEAAKAAGTIPIERRNQISQRELVPVDGSIYGEWAIGPHEPAGHRHLQVFVDGELAGDFEFDVR